MEKVVLVSAEPEQDLGKSKLQLCRERQEEAAGFSHRVCARDVGV